jgi:preprotein translocase subunit SecG
MLIIIVCCHRWWQVLDIIQLNMFMSARGITFFLVFFYIFVALLFFTLILCAWVAWSFKNQQFDYVW